MRVYRQTLTMNKQDMIDWVHGKIGGTKVAAEEVVEGLIGAITDTLKKGGEVSIAGLGIFSVKQRAARTARNPKTGAAVQRRNKKSPADVELFLCKNYDSIKRTTGCSISVVCMLWEHEGRVRFSAPRTK